MLLSKYKELVAPFLLAIVLQVPATAVSTKAIAESMTGAVKRAVRHHPSRLAARESVRAQANELEGSRSGYLPRVSLFGDIGAEYVDNSSSLSRSDNGTVKASRQVGISAQLTLFDGYETANTIYRRAAALDAGLYGLLATSETVALNAVEAYIDVVRHRDLHYVARKNIKRHRRIARQIRARVSGGKSPASDRFQIEERVLAAEAVLVEIKQALGEANAKYKRVVGRSPGKKMRIPRVKRIAKNVNQLVQRAVANNFEIKNNNKLISEAEYARDASRSATAPKLFLEGRTSAGADRNGSRGTEYDAYVGLKLQWNLYDGGATDSRENALAARAGEAAFRRDLKVREIREAAERAWNSYIQGRRRAAILGAQLKANKRIVGNYREEYELAKRSLLDVLDAERARFNSEFQQISVGATYKYAPFRMLATESRLARYFGAAYVANVAKPDFEGQVLDTPRAIFNINIEPLK